MDEVLTIEEIKQRFPDEWVLIENPQTNEFQQVVAGRVRHHEKDRDAVYRKAGELPRPVKVAVRYTGELFREGRKYCLSWGAPGGLGLSAEEWAQFFKQQAAQAESATASEDGCRRGDSDGGLSVEPSDRGEVMDEVLTIEEIKRQFPEQWVLLEDPEINEFEQVVGGRVRHHGDDPDEVYEKVAELGIRHSAVRYMGYPPEDVEFIL
jgi:hypothetical protein